MSKSRRNVLTAVIVVASLSLTGCNPLQYLSGVVLAAQIAIPAVAAAGGISQAESTRLLAYLNAVNTAVGQTTTELASQDSPQLKATKITGYFAAAAQTSLAGTSASVAGKINAVDQAIESFLTSIGSSKAAAARPGLGQVSAPKGVAKTKISTSDLTNQLNDIQSRNEANKLALERAQEKMGAH